MSDASAPDDKFPPQARDDEPQARSTAPPQEVWYAAGLRFGCLQSGECCTGDPGAVWVNGEEIAALAGFVKMPVDEFERVYVRREGKRRTLRELAGGDCVFYGRKLGGCEVYSTRPIQCQTWPFWESNLASPEAWRQAGKECAGVRPAQARCQRLYTLDEIRNQLDAYREARRRD